VATFQKKSRTASIFSEGEGELGNNETAAAKGIGLLCYMQIKEHPGSKTSGDTRRGAARAAAGTTFTGGIVAACSNFPAPPCE
jgi:hypothetical protein